MLELRSRYETIFAFEMAKDTLRRTMLRVLEATGERGVVNAGRPRRSGSAGVRGRD